jgi:hypothetical protein
MCAIVGCGVIAGCDGTSSTTNSGDPGTVTAGAVGTAPDQQLFIDIAREVGLDFRHVNGMSGERYYVETVGAGAAMLDYDNDGDLDVYLVQGHPLERGAPSPTPASGGRLYRNDLEVGPDGGRKPRFTDVTEAAGLRATGYGMGVATGDYDNDGLVDLYLTNGGPNQLWRNKGDGSFEDVTAASGTDDPSWSSSASFVDYDRDGWLDLMVVNYVAFSLDTHKACYSTSSGRLDYCGPSSYPPQADRLLRNRGDGSFEDVTLPAGIAAADGPGLGVVATDVNGDDWPDLWVANDGDDNQLWINQAGERFTDEALISGTAVNRNGEAEAGMGVAASDVDNDGDDDLLVTHLNAETNTLYVNDGQGLFEDASQRSGLGPPSWPMTAWGIADFDYDNDGWRDFLIADGEVRVIEAQETAGDPLPLKQTLQLYRGLGGGEFADVSAEAGDIFRVPEIGRGVAAGDIDNDGDTDALILNNNGPAWLLENQVGQAASWLGVRLLGTDGKRDMLGARAAIAAGDGRPPVWRRAHSDGSYASAGDPRILFGLGDARGPVALRVAWPDGKRERFEGLDLGRYHALVQGTGRPDTGE